jgi:hypothetical protein
MAFYILMARAFPAHAVRPRVLTRLACAEYLEAIIGDERPDPGAYLSRVKECPASQFIFADEKRPKFFGKMSSYLWMLIGFILPW